MKLPPLDQKLTEKEIQEALRHGAWLWSYWFNKDASQETMNTWNLYRLAIQRPSPEAV